ncbi:MAG: hypothetical protein GEV09_13240 [Pseudonocardiaceae bacterium]|nr:hypothetical protein [Pseudonocardiaceae bacterium]
MIVCTECGERQDDDVVFCGRCGAYLEWEGERVEVPRSEDTGTAGAGEAPVVPASASQGVTPVQPPAAGTPEQPPGDASDQAAAVVTRQPEEVRRRPGGPAPRRIEQLPTGSLICGSCGEGNDPERRFCLRCGHSLAGAQVVARPPWWRRLFRRERTYVAGTRRRPRRRGRLVLRLVLILALIAGVLALIGPLRPSVVAAYQWVANTIAGPQQVRPGEATASASAEGHAPGLAFDGANNTYWAATPDDDAPFLRATMPEPVHLVMVGITPGTSLQTPVFLEGPRPQVIEIAAETADGVRVERLTLEPNPGFQKLQVDLPAVQTLTIAVVSGQGATEQEAAAITEVEFFARR